MTEEYSDLLWRFPHPELWEHIQDAYGIALTESECKDIEDAVKRDIDNRSH